MSSGDAQTKHQTSESRTRPSLSVNVNKVATLRNTRSIGVPSPERAAQIALLAGADGVTVHPRPDERHILRSDVAAIARLFDRFPEAEYNIEGNPRHGLIEIAAEFRPDQVTLVPDAPDIFTSDQGWDFVRDKEELRHFVQELHALDARVSLFADPDPEGMAHAAETGADRVELYTEPYAATEPGSDDRAESLVLYAETARAAAEAGLGVNAGHDLNRENLGPFLQAVPGIAEVSIGHALIADAIEFGLRETIRRYVEIIENVSS